MNVHSFFYGGLRWVCGLIALGSGATAFASPEEGEGEGQYRFAVHESPYATVWIERVVPAARLSLAQEARCTVLFGVNSLGEKTAWPQDCDEVSGAASLAAARHWVYEVGDVRPGELYARFHAEFVFAVEGEPYVQMPWHVLRTPPAVYPERLRIRSEIAVRERRAVELPEAVRDAHARPHACAATVALSSKGAPRSITEVVCPEAWTPTFVKSIRKWRWEKLRENGEPFEANARVVVTFR